MLHLIYMVTHIYITFILLFISFFILLLHLWAGRLALILLVGNSSVSYMDSSDSLATKNLFQLQDLLPATDISNSYRMKLPAKGAALPTTGAALPDKG
jgi:hypothetical protein